MVSSWVSKVNVPAIATPRHIAIPEWTAHSEGIPLVEIRGLPESEEFTT
jgi:hypothetical protein